MDNETDCLSEADCFTKLLKLTYPDGFRCRSCGSTGYWSKPERRIIICRKCRKEASPLAGTMFGRSHLSLARWFAIIAMMTSSPERVITAKTVFKELELGSYQSAWGALNKVRYAISRNEPVHKLKGLIEFDEMVISGVGSEYRKLSILGALEMTGERRLTLSMIKNPDEMNLKVYLRKHFSRDVTVITDPEKLYISNWLQLNRFRQVSSVKMYGTNFLNLHIILQDIRFGLRNGHHSVSEKYLQRNLDEFVFIFNHNDDRPGAFEKVIDYMIKTKIKDYRISERKKPSVLSIIRGENQR